MSQPPLKSLHSDGSLSRPKLEKFRRAATQDLIDSLRPGEPGSLKARPDGTIIEGHHPGTVRTFWNLTVGRIRVLRDLGVDVDALAREVIPKDRRE